MKPDPTYPDFPPGYLDGPDPDVRSLLSSAGGPAPDPIHDLLAQIVAAHTQAMSPAPVPPPLNLAQRMGPLYAPPMPRSSNERDVGGRSFLSGLAQGFNGRGGFGLDGKTKPASALLSSARQPSPLDLARFGLEVQRYKSGLENTNTDNARAAQALKDTEAYRAEMEKERIQNHADSMENQRRDDARAERYYQIALAGLGLRRNADARAADRAKLQKQVSDTFAKWPPMMQHEYESRLRLVFDKSSDPDQRDEAVNQLNADFLQRSQALGSQSDRYGNPVTPGKQYGPAPIPPDAKGARAAAGTPRAGLKPSENPALSPDKRKWFKQHPQYDIAG